VRQNTPCCHPPSSLHISFRRAPTSRQIHAASGTPIQNHVRPALFKIAATNPELSQSERGDILKDLGLLDDGADIMNHDKSTVL
jgi:hypothetical protein